VGKYGNIWIWFTQIIIVIFIAVLIILFKLKAISIKWFFFLFIFHALLFLIFLIAQIVSIFSYNDMNKNKGVHSIMPMIHMRINSFLREFPDGETIDWNETKLFGVNEIRPFSTNNGTKEYYGVAAMLSHSKKWVVINYSLEKKDIVKYVANPSPEQLKDPFFDFKVIDSGVPQKDSYGFDRYERDYDRRGSHVHIHGQERRREEGETRATNGVDKAYDALRRSG
jgi:hypothetical protein